jgi:hypothetical protein
MAAELNVIIRDIVKDTLKKSAPGISETMRQAIANSLTLKLAAAIMVPSERPRCTCPGESDETPHDGKRCAIHGCHPYGAGTCDLTPADQRCKDCPCNASPVVSLLSALADEEAANLAAHIWAAGAGLETANFVGSQLAKKNVRLVPDGATEEMWQAGRRADEVKGDSYSKVYLAMIEAAPRA